MAVRFAELALGILTAVGGFVDVSELVFMSQAGSRFGYALIWVVVLATVGIMVFGEMSGRVAAIAKQPVFNLMRHRLGLKLGLIVLVASFASNLITCAAEIGGVALILRLLTGAPYWLMAIAATFLFIGSVWVLPFKWIERAYGLLGLFMLVFIAALVAIHPPWAEIARGALPQIPAGLSNRDLLAFAYFAVALISAVMFPYETYFYSSGGIEDRWTAKDLGINRLTAIVGFALGSLLAITLLASSAQLFGPAGISPDMVGSAALQVAVPFGTTGLLLALLGMFFAISGAAIETCLANAYSLCQFFGWRWGRHSPPQETPRFTLTWLAVFAAALLIVLTGVEPIELAEYAVVASILVLPLTYLPLLLLAGDRTYMRAHANGTLAKTLGWGYFVLIVVAALAALPLYLITSGGAL
jgi:manganese transport protein